ncbi:hypothetical protein AB0B30_06590 [Streptomyces narbonensis]|uniref:Uncharacterized protein n=1 Tax=Streptomyces narbonensis TaxID=67333 RepID=A0ABV3CC86_9ACTN
MAAETERGLEQRQIEASSYARMLQPGEKPQRCCSLPGKVPTKARRPVASLPAQWATALPG